MMRAHVLLYGSYCEMNDVSTYLFRVRSEIETATIKRHARLSIVITIR